MTKIKEVWKGIKEFYEDTVSLCGLGFTIVGFIVSPIIVFIAIIVIAIALFN